MRSFIEVPATQAAHPQPLGFPMPNRNTRFTRIALAMAVLIAIGFGVKMLWFPSAEAPSYVTAPVTVADIEQTVIATGTLEAINLVSVGAQVSGRVVSLKVDVGDVVTSGQLIAEIDSLPQQNTLLNAEAGVRTTQAQRLARVAALKQAELAFARQQQMMAADATPRAEFEGAEATLAATRADIAALDAQLAQGKIQVDTARLNLGYTKITAPIDGTIVAVVTREGQTVNANQSAPTIVKLAQLDTLTVKAQISEADVPKVKAGQNVWFTILGEPDQRYYATLRAVEPAPESIATESSSGSSSTSTTNAVYYNGLFDVPNPDGKLRIAMTAQVNVVLAEAKDTLTIPSSALAPVQRGPERARGARSGEPRGPAAGAAREGSNERSVRILDADDNAVTRTVRVGINNNVSAQILDGLSEGDRVITGESGTGTRPATQGSQRVRRPMGF